MGSGGNGDRVLPVCVGLRGWRMVILLPGTEPRKARQGRGLIQLGGEKAKALGAPKALITEARS